MVIREMNGTTEPKPKLRLPTKGEVVRGLTVVAFAVGAREVTNKPIQVEAGNGPWASDWTGAFNAGGAIYIDCPTDPRHTESGTVKLAGGPGVQMELQTSWRVVGLDNEYGKEHYGNQLVTSDENGEVHFSVTGEFDLNAINQGRGLELHLGANGLDMNGNPYHNGIGVDVNCNPKETATPDATSTSTEELPTETSTPRATRTPKPTKTPTQFEITNTFTPNPTNTATPGPTDTEVPTLTPTITLTPSPTPTGEWVSPTPSNTPVDTDTPVPSSTPTSENTRPATQPATSTKEPTSTPEKVATAVHELAAGGSQKTDGKKDVAGLLGSLSVLSAVALRLFGKRKK